MKLRLLVFLSFLAFLELAPAQTATTPPTPPASSTSLEGAFPFLSASELSELKAAYMGAVAKNPQLSQELTGLLSDLGKTSDPAQLDAFREKALNVQKDVRAALIKEDPQVGPIIDKIVSHFPQFQELNPPGN